MRDRRRRAQGIPPAVGDYSHQQRYAHIYDVGRVFILGNHIVDVGGKLHEAAIKAENQHEEIEKCQLQGYDRAKTDNYQIKEWEKPRDFQIVVGLQRDEFGCLGNHRAYHGYEKEYRRHLSVSLRLNRSVVLFAVDSLDGDKQN